MSKKFVDLFAGCGGLSLGMEKAGFTVSFASDIDPVCSNTYIKNRNLDSTKMFVGDIAVLNEKFDEYKNNFIGTLLPVEFPLPYLSIREKTISSPQLHCIVGTPFRMSITYILRHTD